jgi:hypothetical protein
MHFHLALLYFGLFLAHLSARLSPARRSCAVIRRKRLCFFLQDGADGNEDICHPVGWICRAANTISREEGEPVRARPTSTLEDGSKLRRNRQHNASARSESTASSTPRQHWDIHCSRGALLLHSTTHPRRTTRASGRVPLPEQNGCSPHLPTSEEAGRHVLCTGTVQQTSGACLHSLEVGVASGRVPPAGTGLSANGAPPSPTWAASGRYSHAPPESAPLGKRLVEVGDEKVGQSEERRD